ncbi:iron complex outermembrane receptor protein [Altererythrobacter atlanticus]|nr:TonB-dependent receptor [Croceibacterium atlanticum]MBB5733484.1 iron complex outermembrane receptor protein [Croceibacterium atlanticum]
MPAVAQDQDRAADAEEARDTVILVTGSRIRGIDPTGSPVIGLGRENIEMSSGTTTTEILSELPQVFNLGATDASFTSANNQNANRTAGTGVNLRGLGTESTLTLIDGRRVAAGGTQSQYFDPSVIPTMAIGRLEVLPDGSSGIYGSDAVGGVVNILLRKNLDGAEAMGRVKFADGFEEYQAGAAIGKDWSTGSLLVAGEYVERGTLFAADRSFYTDDLRPYGGPDLRSEFSSPGNITAGGVTYAIPDGDGTGLTQADFTAGTRNLQSAYLLGAALPPQERYSFAGTFEQDLGNVFSVYAQGVIAHRESIRPLGPLSAQFDVPTSNPFYVNPGDPGDRVTVSYSFINDNGSITGEGKQDFIHVTGGLNADLGAWNANVFYAYGENKERSSNPQIDNAALQAALADSNAATAFNPFSSNGNNNSATIAAITGGEFRVDTNYYIDEFGASLDGTLFTMPGGDVKLAIGVSRQDINWQDLAPFQTDLNRTVDSVFGELFVPVLGGEGPALNISAAVRYDDYSDIGDTTNPKIGVNFIPVDSLTIRGSFGTSFRAPTLADTGSPFNQYATFFDSDNVARQVLFLRGGNPGLEPETATTWSFGADFEPDWAPGLRLSATYYNVDYTNRIATPGNDRLALQKPELAPVITIGPDLARVVEIIEGGLFSAVPADPSDVYALVDGRKVNLGALKTEGLEFIGSYNGVTDWGGWRAGFNAAYILNFRRSIITGAPLSDVVDTINNPAQLAARAYAGADIGGFSATLFAKYLGGYENDTVAPVQDVPSHVEFDLALRYRIDSPFAIMEGVTFTLDVEDIFDNNPPYVQNGNLAFDPNAHDMVGRTVALGVRANF